MKLAPDMQATIRLISLLGTLSGGSTAALAVLKHGEQATQKVSVLRSV